MKKVYILFFLVMLVGLSWAQRPNQNQYTVTLNEKSISPGANFQEVRKGLQAEGLNIPPSKVSHFILQFSSLPTLEEQKQLKTQGITLLNYVQGNAYFVSVNSKFYSIGKSESKNIRSLIDIQPEYKIRQDLAGGNIPEYAKVGDSKVSVVITWFDDVDDATVADEISKFKITHLKMMGKFQQFSADVAISDLEKLASLDWVQNIEPIAPPLELENNHGKSLHRANVLGSSIPGLGYGLTGKGVKVGLWDADVYNHRDFNGRVTNREFETHTTDHGTHTCGTITGAGLLDPKAQGMAPEATVYAWNFNTQSNGLSVPSERLLALDNDGIEITSNSWGYNVTTCPNPYAYNSTDHNEDLIASWYPYFLYVFSAGNNQSICTGGFNTTSKNMKNSLMVAAIDQMDNMSSFSSYGPSKDGRLIPNISGDGVDVYSTFFDNGYGIMSGTSMATPGVAGTMALVYQRYKETHGGQQPDAAFLRALACNTAKDLGAPGPDYKYGYGEINGLHAVEVMEQNNYFLNSVSQGTSYTKNITIPAGAVALKVMLSWTDPTGTVGSSRILVNDLDLSVTNGGTTILPWVLDPANPSANAVRGFDGLNNLEQVTLSNPATGTYTINISGYQIPAGVQQFAVVYDIVMPALRLTYPIGGEFIAPGNQEVIRWDCEGYNKTYTLEYSTDGGVNYSVIASNIASTSRSYLWTVPAGTTTKAKFRITNGTVLDVDKGTFNIMPVPQNVKIAPAQCGGAGPFAMQWDAVANAKYEVLKLNGQVYEHLADVATNTFDITGITQNNNNWYCIRAIDLTTGAISQRSLAITVNPAVPVSAIPFSEKFESQKADNFYFTAVKGQGNVRYVNDAQKYGIRLEGTSGATTDWVAGTNAACFTNNPTYVVKATICNIDATSLAGKIFRLKFDYRQKYRTAAGTAYFRVKVNGDYLTNIDGTQIYGTTNQVSYKSVYYDLTAYARLPSVSVEFEAVCKTNYTTYVDGNGNYNFSLDTYDIGDFVTIDNVEILEAVEDMSLTSLTVSSGITNAETITVKVKNSSGISVTNVPVSYALNGGAAVNELVSGPIAPMAEATYAFTTKADFSVGGIYSVTASVNRLSDPISSNNTLTITKANNGTDVVMGITTGTVTTCSATVVDPGGRYADYDISLNKNITLKPGTAGKNIKITFTEFATEQDYDFLYVYSGTAATAANLLGKFSGSDLPPTFTSLALGGELYLRFTSDAGVNDKGFIATIECVDKVTDGALTAITAPTASGVKTASETVSVTVSNPGSPDLINADVYYQIGTNTPVHEQVASIVSGATAISYSFATKADLSVPGTYTLKAWIEVPGDAVAVNNSVTTTITSTAAAIPTSDAGISAITAIRPARAAFSTIAATVKNFGNISISNVDVAYKVNGGTEVVQTITGPIAVGATAAITFTVKADLTAAGTTSNIDVYTKFAGDVLATNDKMTSVVITPTNAATNVVGSFLGGTNAAIASATPGINLVNNYTIECWVNLSDPASYGHIFNKTNVWLWYSTSYGAAFYGTNSFILSANTSSGAITWYVPNAVKLGTWQHLALTVSSSNVYTLYIDGVAQTWTIYSGATSGSTTANFANPICIGNRPTDLIRSPNGFIDEFRVWNTALDQPTISSNMMTDYAANTAGLVAYYKFKEGNSNYVYDYSSNDNTAIISGADVSDMGSGKFWNTPGFLLKNFSIAGEKVPTTFDASTSTFNTIMDAADLNSLVANFPTVMNSVIKVGAEVQTSGVTANNFSAGSLLYTADGTGFNTGISQNYTVKVANDLSDACDLTAYSFEPANNLGLTSSIIMDINGSNLYKKVTAGMNLSSLKASFTASPSARVYINGVLQTSPQAISYDYTNPLMVTVISENGRTLKNYSITLDARSSDADLTAFNIPGEQVAATNLDAVNHTIGIWVKNSTDLTMLAPTYTVSPNAKVYVNNVTQWNSMTANNFTNPLMYKVVSEDESKSVDWTVTIARDEAKPVITLAGVTPVTVAYGSVFTDPGATAMDNVDGDITSKIITTGSVNTAAVGSYILTYTVTDIAGNTAVAIRTVVVADQDKPVITLNGTSPMTVGYMTTFVDPGATATDNLDGDITSLIVVTGSVNVNIPGPYTLTYNVQDAAGNKAEKVIRVVNVTAYAKPVISLLGESTITVVQGTAFTDPGATAVDKVDGNITSKIVVTGSVNTSLSGSYTLTYNVTDAAGNTAIPVYRIVNVTDATKPVITLNGTTPMSVVYGSVFTDPGATATDNVDGNLTAAISTAGSVNTAAIGTYTLTYNVQDAAGNKADEVTRTVNVVKATASVEITDLSKYFNGNPLEVTVTTVPAGLPVIVTYNGSTTVPSAVGIYAVVATINDINYEGENSASFEIMLNTGIAPLIDNAVKIYSDGTSVYVSINKIRTSSHLTVFDVNGNIVYQISSLSEGLTKINRNFISSVYVIKLVVDDKLFSKRVVLTK